MSKILIDEAKVKLVLESLVYASSYCDTYNAITALREALAEQPEQQEPVVALLAAIQAEPVTLIHKWRVLELVKDYAPPAQQEPVAAECKFDHEQRWCRCEIEHHNFVQSKPHNWPGYKTRLLYTAPQAHRTWVVVSDRLPLESDGEVLVRMRDGRCEIAWATYWHGASNAFSQWTFRDPDEDEAPTHWMHIPAIEAAHNIKE